MAWLMYDWDRDRARDDLERALELSPNGSLANWAYTEYLLVVEPAAALGSALRTLALDPLSLPIMNLVAFSYLERGMLDEAQRMDEEMLALDPTFNAAHWNRGVVHLLRGQFEAALGDLDRSVAYSGGMVPTLAIQALAHARSGDEAKALAILSELESRRELPERGYVSPVLIAAVYEGLGKTEEALSWLETGLEERDGWLIFLNAFPRFESLRAEARFEKVLQHVGLPANDHR